MYITKNLKNHASAQCHVRIWDNGDIDFISYVTRVISIHGDKIECTGTYSQTTAKQIGWFLREYMSNLTYYDMKKIAGKGFVTC